jgi:protein SCO1
MARLNSSKPCSCRTVTRGSHIANCTLASILLLVAMVGAGQSVARQPDQTASTTPDSRTFLVKGVIERLVPGGPELVVRHEAIPNYMGAMTMPFKVRDTNEVASLGRGDAISFLLHVTEQESWIDRIVRTGSTALPSNPSTDPVARATDPSTPSRHPLMDYRFTNELGQAVSLSDFRGQALAITFFFTRCPIPDYCPRLSKNFEEVCRKLSTASDSPTNWHLLSVTFDPDFDTAEVLKAYGKRYQYDPKRWSFLTGPSEKIKELAHESDVNFEREGAFINHSFRTLIIDAAGQLQMIFPTSGDLSEAIAAELAKAAAVTNRSS